MNHVFLRIVIPRKLALRPVAVRRYHVARNHLAPAFRPSLLLLRRLWSARPRHPSLYSNARIAIDHNVFVASRQKRHRSQRQHSQKPRAARAQSHSSHESLSTPYKHGRAQKVGCKIEILGMFWGSVRTLLPSNPPAETPPATGSVGFSLRSYDLTPNSQHNPCRTTTFNPRNPLLSGDHYELAFSQSSGGNSTGQNRGDGSTNSIPTAVIHPAGSPLAPRAPLPLSPIVDASTQSAAL